MPGLFHEPISRKKFLTASGAIVGGLLAAGRSWGDEASDHAHIALLSDTHIPADASNEYRGFRPVENLQQVVPQVVAANPQAALINGDAARLTGEHEDYVALKSLLQPIAAKAPVHIGLGNHDDRRNFFNVFPSGGNNQAPLVDGKHVSVFVAGGVRFVVLDSLLYVDKVAGLLGKGQRAWLSKFLAVDDETPTVFFVHHTLGDGDGDLLDFERVFQILKPYRKVKAIFYGHSHRWHMDQRDHIYLINQPAVGYNFADDQPVGWLDAKFSARGVDLTLQAIGGNQKDHGKMHSVTWS